jgi:hypothetical protein
MKRWLGGIAFSSENLPILLLGRDLVHVDDDDLSSVKVASLETAERYTAFLEG